VIPSFSLFLGVNKPSFAELAELELPSSAKLIGGSKLLVRLSKVLSLESDINCEWALCDLSGELFVQWFASSSYIFCVALFFLYSKALFRQSRGSETC
jgi:hypothetical protein